ncbi:MAG: ribonuclease P protein component [Bacilli bacterium]|nr:ribonuclease P protein component [Bacilli bacterium]
MKKKFIVKSNREFNEIINSKHSTSNSCFIVYYKKAKEKYSRFGISVGKKIGKATIRNKYKRKIRAIIDNNKKDYSNNLDYIIIMRKECLNQKHEILEKNLNILIKNIDRNDLNEKEKNI